MALEQRYDSVEEWLDLAPLVCAWSFANMKHPEYLEKPVAGKHTPKEREVERAICGPVVLYIGQLDQAHLEDVTNERLYLDHDYVPPIAEQ